MQLWRSPQAVLLVSRRAVQRYLAPVQLSGLRIGIGMPSAAGSHAAWAALRKGGVATSAVDWVSLGASEGALAALEHMQVDALVAQDPVVSLLERDFAVQIAADTRTLTGSRALFGTDWVGTCLVARASWVSANAQRAQAAVSALARSLKWLQTAQAGDLVKVLPAQLGVGRVADHVLAFEKARSALSSDGVLSGDDMGAMLDVMRRLQAKPTAGDWRRALAPQFAEQARALLVG
jgi:NitT/TauT family transport system substrate-binding protein